MMKNMIALVLVLGMASLASAGLIYSVDGVDAQPGTIVSATDLANVTIGIVNETQTKSAPLIGGVLISGGAYTDASVMAANLPGSWSVTAGADLDPSYADYYLITYDVPAVADTLAGTLFTFDVAFGLAGGTLQMLDGNLAGIADAVTVVPEPMTLGLLGLGGLFLRRRK